MQLTLNIEAPQLDRIIAALERLADAEDRRRPRYLVFGGDINIGEFVTMITVVADHQDEAYSISAVTVADSENNPIAFTEEFTSTDTAVISIIPNDPANVRLGMIHVGAPGVASINYTVKVGADIVLSKGKQFTVTTGAVAVVTGGDIDIPGLPEDPTA